jgi:predicted ATP-dependent serine protease
MSELALQAYEDLISHLDVPYLKFQCSNCGFRPADLQWQCPQCRQWDSIDFMDSLPVDSASLRSEASLPIQFSKTDGGEE